MNDTAQLVVHLFGADAGYDQRHRIRDTVQNALQASGGGQYLGGGSLINAAPNYNVEFEIANDGYAIALVRDTLRQLAVGTETELSLNRDQRYNVYDDAWTDLGPRPVAPAPNPGGIPGKPCASPEEFMAEMKAMVEAARKQYGGPK